MGVEEEPQYGTIRFIVPDLDVSAQDRSLFGFPGNKESVDEQIKLHNFRTSQDVVKGPEGLDVQGFAYVEHRSVLSTAEQWADSKRVEEVYLPEVEELICKLTGAKRAVANNVAIRRKLATENDSDPKFYYKKDCALDVRLQTLPKGRPISNAESPSLCTGESKLTFSQSWARCKTTRWNLPASHILITPSRACVTPLGIVATTSKLQLNRHLMRRIRKPPKFHDMQRTACG